MLTNSTEYYVVDVQVSWLDRDKAAQTVLLEFVSVLAWDFNCQGVEEPERGLISLRIWFSTVKDAEAFVDELEHGGSWTVGATLNCRIEKEENVDWIGNWRHHFHHIPVGKKFLIAPPWEAESVRNKHPERVIIQIEPGMAFGTGTHETTQMCLELAESHLNPGTRVLDIGTGSGILAIAAILCEVDHAVGIEIDPDAEENFRYNVALNLPDPANCNKVEFLLSDGLTSLNKLDFDLIFANMLSNRLERVFEQMKTLSLSMTKQENTLLVCSGILIEEWSALRKKWKEKFQLMIEEELHSGEWIGFTARLGNET